MKHDFLAALITDPVSGQTQVLLSSEQFVCLSAPSVSGHDAMLLVHIGKFFFKAAPDGRRGEGYETKVGEEPLHHLMGWRTGK